MRKKLLAILIVVVLMIISACARDRKLGHSGNDSGSPAVPRLSLSEISQTPLGVTIRFEAIVVNRPSQKCIELFTPDEFKKYDGDSKWAISSALGFQLGLFETLPDRSLAIVTGKYIFVRDVHDGPCGAVTGRLFEISGIEYF